MDAKKSGGVCAPIRGPQHARSRPSPLQRTLGRAHLRRQHPRRDAPASRLHVQFLRVPGCLAVVASDQEPRADVPTGSKTRLERLWI